MAETGMQADVPANELAAIDGSHGTWNRTPQFNPARVG